MAFRQAVGDSSLFFFFFLFLLMKQLEQLFQAEGFVETPSG